MAGRRGVAFSEFQLRVSVPVLVPVPSSIWLISIHLCETSDEAQVFDELRNCEQA